MWWRDKGGYLQAKWRKECSSGEIGGGGARGESTLFELRLEAFFRKKGHLGRRNSICKDTKEYGVVRTSKEFRSITH